jgi:hypothetical protein
MIINKLIGLCTVIYVRALNYPSLTVHESLQAADPATIAEGKDEGNSGSSKSQAEDEGPQASTRHTLVAFKNIADSLENIMEVLEKSGFEIERIYKLPNGKYMVTAHISSKLLVMMASIYANDLVNTKTAEMYAPQFHMRMTEKAISTIPNSFLSKISYQIVSPISRELSNALKAGKIGPVNENLHKYFGARVAVMLGWLRYGSQALYPGLLLWVAMTIGEEEEYAPVVGTIIATLFSFSLGYWKVSLDGMLHRFSYCRDLSLPNSTMHHEQHITSQAMSLPMLACSILAVFAICLGQLLFAVVFNRIHWSRTIYACLAEVVYYVVAMSIAIIIEHTVLLKLTDLEALPSMKGRSTSNAVKQFVVKVGVFATRVGLVILKGPRSASSQLPMTCLMGAHCCFFVNLVFFWRAKLGTRSSSYSFSKNVSRLPLELNVEDVEKVLVYKLSENSAEVEVRLTREDKRRLQDCCKPSFATQSVLAGSTVTIAAMLLLARVAPAAVALCMIELWGMSKRVQYHLVHSCQYPHVTDISSMEPYLSIIETFSILVMAWNIGTLFLSAIEFQTELPDVFSGTDADVVDNLVWKLFASLNSTFQMPNSYLSVVIWCIVCEHVVMLVRCVVFPYCMYLFVGFNLDAQRALFSVADKNDNISTMLYRQNLLSKSLFEKSMEADNSESWKQQYRLAKTHSVEDSSMSPVLYAALAMVPFCCSTFFSIPWYYTTFPVTALCSYFHTKIKRQKHAIALSIVSDPDVFDVVAKNEFKQFTYSSETDRSSWCNKMLALCWPALKEFAYLTIKNVADPELERSKPSIANFLRMSKLTMGDTPPHFLPGGIRVLEPVPGKDMVEMEVDIVWNSDMEVAISLGLGMGQEITLNMSKLRFSGTCRVQCLPLIDFVPPFAWGKVTFFKKPFIDFSLVFGDTELLEGTDSQGTLTTIMRSTMRKILENMALYPNWINVPMVGKVERFIKYHPDYYLNTPPIGILSITVVRANNLIVGDITTSDPYVVLTMRDEEYQTEVIYKTLNPEWKDAEFSFLIYDKKMESVHVEVWDKDFGSVGSFLGRTQVYFANMEYGSTEKLTLQLQGVSSGTISLELNFSDIVSSNHDQSEEGSDAAVDMKTLFDTMMEDDCKELAAMVNMTEGDSIREVVYPSTIGETFCTSSSSSFRHSSKYSHRKKHHVVRRLEHFTSSPNIGMPRLAGVLTISSVGFSEVKSVKTLLSSTQYFSPYITFTMGNIKRQTVVASTKKSSQSFSTPFTFVVNSVNESIRIKLKYSSAISGHVCLYEWSSSVSEIIANISAAQASKGSSKRKIGQLDEDASKLSIRQSIYDGLKLAMGNIFFKLDFRSTVAHMRYESETRAFNMKHGSHTN